MSWLSGIGGYLFPQGNAGADIPGGTPGTDLDQGKPKVGFGINQGRPKPAVKMASTQAAPSGGFGQSRTSGGSAPAFKPPVDTGANDEKSAYEPLLKEYVERQMKTPTRPSEYGGVQKPTLSESSSEPNYKVVPEGIKALGVGMQDPGYYVTGGPSHIVPLGQSHREMSLGGGGWQAGVGETGGRGAGEALAAALQAEQFGATAGLRKAQMEETQAKTGLMKQVASNPAASEAMMNLPPGSLHPGGVNVPPGAAPGMSMQEILGMLHQQGLREGTPEFNTALAETFRRFNISALDMYKGAGPGFLGLGGDLTARRALRQAFPGMAREFEANQNPTLLGRLGQYLAGE